MSDLIRLTGLWQRMSDKTGKPYFVGKLGAAKVMLCPNNEWREGNGEPTHVLLCTSPTPNGQRKRADSKPQASPAQDDLYQRPFEDSIGDIGR